MNEQKFPLHDSDPRDMLCETIDRLIPLYDETERDAPESVQTCNPDSEKVIRALQIVIDVLLPGRMSSEHIEPGDFRVVLFRRLSAAWRFLRPEIEQVIPLRWLGEAALMGGEGVKQDAREESIKVVQSFMENLPRIREEVIEDIRAAYNGDPAALSYAEVHLTYPGLLAITSHRIAHELYRLEVPVIPRLMSEWIHNNTGVDIHPGAKIGKGFFMDHATGIVIGETATIGDHVKLYQGVTLGARSFPLDEQGRPIKHVQRHPTVEDNVVIYANATILGGDTVIGANSTIGGSVFITKSVPPNSFVGNKHPELSIKQNRNSSKS